MKKFFFAFKIYYFIYLLLAFNAFVNETAWMGYAALLLTGWGAAVLLCMLVQYKKYINMVNVRLILAFFVSYALSSVLMFRYGVTDNLKEMVWLCLSMGVVYAAGHICTAEEKKREMKVICSIWAAVCTAMNAVSISMIVWGREYPVVIYENGKEVGYKVVGFLWGRLWGMYDDPNHGATITVAAVLLTLYLVTCLKKRWTKVLLSLTLVIHFSYIILSDSRTGLVTLGVGVGLWAVGMLYGRRKNSPKAVNRFSEKPVLLSMAGGILLAFFVIGAVMVCKQEYNLLDERLEAILPEGLKTRNGASGLVSGQIGREQDLENDVSNGRLAIWESGLEIFRTSPVTGVSFRNMTAYTRENLPDTYLVKNADGFEYDSLHNTLLDVLVSQGIVGIGIVLLILGNTLWFLWKKWKAGELDVYSQDEMNLIFLCLAVMASMAAGSMFLSIIFYLNAPQTCIFWFCFGDLVSILQKGKEVS